MSLSETVFTLLHRWLLSSPGGGLWYVQAILCMLAILWLLNNRRGSYGGMTAILTVTYLASRVISTNFTELSTVVFPKEYYSLNFLCMGIYFMLGIGLAHYIVRKNVTDQKAIWYLIALIAVQAVVYMIKADSSSSLQTFLLSIMTICTMVLLFLFSYRWKLPIKRETSERLRKMSSIIYFIHFTVIYGVKIAGRLIGVTLSPVWLFGLSAVLLTIIAAILSAPRWNRLSSKLF